MNIITDFTNLTAEESKFLEEHMKLHAFFDHYRRETFRKEREDIINNWINHWFNEVAK